MLNLLFPPLCLSCKGDLEQATKLFCINCQKSLSLIDIKTRCHKCFLDLECGCTKKNNPYDSVAAALEYNTVSQQLIYKLKYGNAFYLSKAAASLMMIQFLNLGWPIPDIITSIPMTFSRYLKRGFNQSSLIANHFSNLIKVPFKPLLKKKGYAPQQASLDLKGRKEAKLVFELKNKKIDLNNKIILIIDDVMTTGKTLQQAGNILKSTNPKMLFALSVCRTNLLE